jgi:hypothetical protein
MPPPPPVVVKKIIPPFPLETLDAYRPWCILTTKVLAEVLGTNPLALAMRLYRGAGPRPVPAEWLKGHVAGFMVADVRSWLGDGRSETDMFRQALPQAMAVEPDEVIRLYACVDAVEVEPIIGGLFSKSGKKDYLDYLRKL